MLQCVRTCALKSRGAENSSGTGSGPRVNLRSRGSFKGQSGKTLNYAALTRSYSEPDDDAAGLLDLEVSVFSAFSVLSVLSALLEAVFPE
jgi:hypothetical protein